MDAKQERAYTYLKEKFESQDWFTKDEFNQFVGWGDNIGTYWSKKIKTLLVEENNKFRVSDAFRRILTKINFEKHISQSTQVYNSYKSYSHKNVILFDFFLPLSNELYLRDALDALFYKDSIMRKLKTIDLTKLELKFSRAPEEDLISYHERICNWVSNKFGGYSISHLSGRFRADKLMTLKDVSEKLTSNGYKYLVDETTAIIRFIFPCGEPSEKLFFSPNDYFDEIYDDNDDIGIIEEAKKIRWFFYILFVQSIIEVINGEDEIWMLESGFRSRLHIWSMNK